MRYNFSKRKNVLPLPNLSNIQTDSYEWLKNVGMAEILEELGTITDYTDRGWTLTFSNPRVDKENISEDDALYSGRTYDASWYLKAVIKDEINRRQKAQTIYMGDLPLMTKRGTFIINGIERVVVNQLTRSAGVLFLGDQSPTTGKVLASAKILPKNGVWLELETSRTGVISVKIDRKRKIAATTLLRVFGLESDSDIRDAFEGVDSDPEVNYIDSTLAKDPSSSMEESALEIYRKMRPGEPLILENAKAFVDSMFFNKRRYSLGEVGRFMLNRKLGLNFPDDPKYYLLQLEDLIKIVSRIIELNNGVGEPDDMDHLGNRRVKSVGELLQKEIRVGFLQMEKNIKERMSLMPRDTLPEPSVLVSTRSIVAKIHSFFASGQLSQFQDQQNPVTALEHLRRLSVMGPGGLSKERASLAVRDVHYSHYGRICPVRTPEGPNIGLINYLASYARINKYGFLETPYFKLKHTDDGRVEVTGEIVFLAAYEEEGMYITDASVEIDASGYIVQNQVPLRKGGEFILGDPRLASYIEVIPRQIVGISAGLIPFLSNDDVTRTLIATQQISQAVPLIRPESPIVGTGIESAIAENAGAVVRAEADGKVVYADGERVEVNYKGKREKVEYKPLKFVKSNHGTCISQTVKVSTGQSVERGAVLIEGPAADDGEIAIGTNLVTVYMIWEGYEYEDGVLISSRLVEKDTLTSIHISNYAVSVLETKLGPEEITCDIPNVSEDSLRSLGKDGIVAVGSKVKAGDVLVGKVAPKGETELSAEERLLRAIFGEKAKEVRDNSLVVPHGEHGVVIGVKRVTKKENKDLPAGVLEEITVYVAQQRKIEVGDKLAGRHGNKGVISAIIPEVDMPHLPDGTAVDIVFSSEAVLKRMNVGQILEAPLGFAGRRLNKKYVVPVFENMSEEDLASELAAAGLPVAGKMKLTDGRTGEYFDGEIVIGETYVLKLNHLGEDKMHARSTGPYSLITQQPLGGKAQFGGQRFGEMEVWALEAYGAAHTLKEMLTIKSDDLVGRTKAYKAVLQGEPIPESNIPESFKLLVRELNGLCLGIEPLGAVVEGESEAVSKGESSVTSIGGLDLHSESDV
ncbi:DNA-directed RNA polymerase subunit beta [candidate division WWE3 bacterium]|nr:DNA-directed RNA polymerase subunit beta [candidate division WWE3 bacterium]